MNGKVYVNMQTVINWHLLIHVHVGDHNRVHEITYGFSGLSEKNVCPH
jgi:hypothetical protein